MKLSTVSIAGNAVGHPYNVEEEFDKWADAVLAARIRNAGAGEALVPPSRMIL